MVWTLLPQERKDQKYFFNGKCYMTHGARNLITEDEARNFIALLQELAIERNGIDYLQTFTDEKGNRIWVIDQLDVNMKKEHPKEHDYFTILLPSEY